MDRITIEILRHLRDGKVLVSWLMDASESLRMRREQVITRSDRVYQELDELTSGQPDVLLTSVASFGKEMHFMTPEPTSDREVILQAVQDITVDDSGIENVFSAIRGTVLHHRPLQHRGYKVLIVVLTDERGNDTEMLDESIQQVMRYEMPVYVMGPMAPFAREQINVRWVDEETNEALFLPVERGPESMLAEFPHLPSWHPRLRSGVVSSGFGPYALSRITLESGGIYFLHDDGNIPDPTFNIANLSEYQPEYLPGNDYRSAIETDPLRRAVVRTALARQEAPLNQPQLVFLESGIQFEIRDNQADLARILDFLDRAVTELEAAKQHRNRETSQRWRAHYDLLLGRLLAIRIRLNNSIPLLNEMFTSPKVCQAGTTNAWNSQDVRELLSSRRKRQNRERRPAKSSRRIARSRRSRDAVVFRKQRMTTFGTSLPPAGCG